MTREKNNIEMKYVKIQKFNDFTFFCVSFFFWCNIVLLLMTLNKSVWQKFLLLITDKIENICSVKTTTKEKKVMILNYNLNERKDPDFQYDGK